MSFVAWARIVKASELAVRNSVERRIVSTIVAAQRNLGGGKCDRETRTFPHLKGVEKDATTIERRYLPKMFDFLHLPPFPSMFCYPQPNLTEEAILETS